MNRRVLLLIVVWLLGLSGEALPQHRGPVLRSKYAQVIDRAFQFSRGIPAEFQGVEYRIVLRFLPSFGSSESQIVIVKEEESTRVFHYRIRDGSPPISELCSQALEKNPEASAEEIFAQIQMEIKESVLPPPLVRLVESIPSAFPTRVGTNVTMDGTIYELWVETLGGVMHARFAEGADAQDVVEWMRTVRDKVENRK